MAEKPEGEASGIVAAKRESRLQGGSGAHAIGAIDRQHGRFFCHALADLSVFFCTRTSVFPL